jgi:hypothetical protein
MKKLTTFSTTLFSTLLLFSTASQASVAGFSDITSSGNGVYTFTFDTLVSDITSTTGLTFQDGASPTLTVTGGGGNGNEVIQDVPSHGGLGVNGGPGGDNINGTEWLDFFLGGAVFDLLGFTLNGGHTDAATGSFGCSQTPDSAGNNDAQTPSGCDNAAMWDGVGAESSAQGFLDLCCNSSGKYTDLTSFQIHGGTWSGYVESITLRTQVSEPAMIALFGLGLMGLGFARRRKA